MLSINNKYHPAFTITKPSGFTIVELLVVIVIIAILATITIVSYTGISSKAVASSLQSDLISAKKQLNLYYVDNSAYPVSINANNCPINKTSVVDSRYCLKPSSGNVFVYISTGAASTPQNFTLNVTNTSSNVTNYIDESSSVLLSDPNWIAGITGTLLDGKWVYNKDVNTTKIWGPDPAAVVSPQGSVDLDTSPYNNSMTLVANNSVNFSAFPARQSCKDLGGRLPNIHEIQAIFTSKASYGNNFRLNNYWTAVEETTYTAWIVYSLDGAVSSHRKGYYYECIRCIKD